MAGKKLVMKKKKQGEGTLALALVSPSSKFHALLSECLKSYWLILLIFETTPEKHDAENFLIDLIHSVGEILPF